MTKGAKVERSMSANGGDSGHLVPRAGAPGDMDYRLMVKAQEMVHVGTWMATLNPSKPHAMDVIWSNEMFRLVGHEPQSFTPTFDTFMASVDPADRERVGAIVAKAIDAREPYQFDYRVAMPDQSLRVLAARAHVEFNERGDLVRIIGTCADITDRFREQQALAASEARLRALFEQAAVGMVVASTDGIILRANRSFAEMLGYSIQELEGMYGFPLIHPDDRPTSANQRGQLQKGQSFASHRRYLRKDGGIVWARVTVSRVNYPDAPEALQAIVEDITDQRRANEELRRQTEILSGMLDHLPVMVLRLDRAGRLIYSNRESQRVFGWSKGEMPADIISAAFPDEVQVAHVRRMLVAGKAEWLDLEPRAEDGRVVPSSWAAITLSDGESLVIGQDLTERRQMQQSLVQSQKLEAIGQLAGGIAHDFNNLLTVISASATFVQDGAGSNAAIASDAQDILTACERAASLTRQLLAFSRRQMLQPEVVNINAAIQGLTKSLSRLLGEHIQLDISCEAPRPSVEVDRHQIEQVILNLSVNARDAIKDHGTISISTQNTVDLLGKPQLLIRVRDDGAGIEPAVMKRIFEPFYTTKAVGKGTGLGLATVHGIVEQSGGRVAVESTVGKGTTFSVFLPSVEVEPLAKRPKLKMSVEGGHETILLVEDENAVRAIARRMLTSLGYRVVEARHGKDGLTVASDKSLHIDLLVTDVIMPEMGGRELATSLRELRPGMPVLYMSGYTDDELLRRGILEPGVRLLRKPFTKPDLARVVRALLTGAAATVAEVIGGGAAA